MPEIFDIDIAIAPLVTCVTLQLMCGHEHRLLLTGQPLRLEATADEVERAIGVGIGDELSCDVCGQAAQRVH